MKAIRIENVRSLKDTGWVPLAPITLLAGQNSSGKSTFLRTFPLMKQSIRTRTDGPMLWAGDVDDYVDFGSFADTVSRSDGQDAKKPREAEAIRFNFRIPISAARLPLRNNDMRKQWEEQGIVYSLEIRSLKQDLRGDYVSRLTVQIANSTFDFEFAPKSSQKGVSVKVNGKEVQTVLHSDENEGQHTFRLRFSSSSMFDFQLPPIADLIKAIVRRYMPDEALVEDDEDDDVDSVSEFEPYILSLARYTGRLLCCFESVQAGLDCLQSTKQDIGTRYGYSPDAYSKFQAKYESLSPEEREKDSLIFRLLYFYYIFDIIEEYLSQYYRQVHYIAPVRATAQRYYRVNNVSVDEVDPQGKNVALFLNNIPKKKAEEFRKWTRENFGFEVRTGDVAGGHISVEISTGANGRTANLADTGFGYSQLLPIIIQLWDLSVRDEKRKRVSRYPALASTPMVIAIEQPELHLHAQLQGKLVHALIAAIKSSQKQQFQFILETHSQTIVNCIGKAIALGKLSPDDVSLVLFDKTIEEPYTEVHTTDFDEDGYPVSWPMGFFVSEEE